MKRILAVVALSALALAAPLPKDGQTYESLSCDLNGDKKPEKVGLTAYNVVEEAESYWGQLTVWDSQGKVLWRAPRAKTGEDAFSFGVWPYGVSPLEWLGPLDGQLTLLSPAAISDARPPTYRRYLWKGGKFVPQARAMLLESPAGSGKFAWTSPIEWDGNAPLTWITSLKGPKLVASIYASKSGGQALVGEARMVSDSHGFRVGSWIKPLSAP